jgi:negative regulator of genetic competence, sporulation and motility
MPKQLFQSRFPKFYQSSELSEQFYKRSTEYSSLVPSRLLSHEYFSLVSSRSFAPSSSLLSVNQSIKSSEYDRELINLTKLYSDETKYSEENDNFSFKLIMFNDMCDRIDVSSETKLKAFPTMLKELALDYYYANVTSSKNASFTLDDVCISMMNYFEDAEYKRSILNK